MNDENFGPRKRQINTPHISGGSRIIRFKSSFLAITRHNGLRLRPTRTSFI